ncbi:MAG TPA: [protein-PII] uridylyltransferase [Pirellulales bacterium]|nr:[protein-PII] uridylyltransferase [Pirellulales bacterium]
MPSVSTLRPCVLAAKDWLAQERAKLKQQHDSGSPGIQVCARLTDMLDHVVLDLHQSALAELAPDESSLLHSEVSLVAHGGYGRRDVAPYSDVDLMILCSPKAAPQVPPLAKRLLHDLYDAGLILGQSVRTVSEAWKLGLKDPTIFTSLVESRLLAGSQPLFENFQSKFQKAAQRHWRRLVGDIEASRHEEREHFGETVYLLEPNVKRSPGGLRDIQLLRWVGFARYGDATPDGLQLMGELSKEDEVALRRALELLLRVRNELHFHAEKEQDVLNRTEQVRMAKVFGSQAAEGLLEVEVFMREYFRNTHAVQQIAARFLEGARPWTKLGDALFPLLSHRVEDDFRIGTRRIRATRAGLEKLPGNLPQILRLVDLANKHDKRIAHSTWETVHRAAPKLPDVITPESAELFLSILSQPTRLGELLRDLHALGVLERLIPAFAHARSLLQFNEYHKFTVDEHCIRAVEAATSFADEPTPWGEVYSSIKDKRPLHLALLIHDLGKGFVADHSEVGLRIAEETAERLLLPQHETEILKFLVHKHLVMSHLAFRRDTSDDQLIVRFAVEVGSAEILRLLFVLTCADLAAVGPGVLNSWKGEVLSDLYVRTLLYLSGDSPSLVADDCRLSTQALLANEEPSDWYVQQTEALNSSYLMNVAPEQIAEELRRLKKLGPGDVEVWHRFLPETNTIEYTVGTYEDISPGIFHKLTGGLSSAGLQILSADINTLAAGLVFDRFRVQDPDYAGQPPPERMNDIDRRLKESLTSDQPPAFRRVWRSSQRKASEALQVLPTQVRCDNSTSERFTVIDVFALDRMGLLYTISRTLFELGLSVSLAKIGTYLDQVVDVFYVTEQTGRKVEGEERLESIRQALLKAIEEFQREGPK